MSASIYGGTLGGPIVKNRLFYFGSYERFKEERGLQETFSVPTARMRQGDFSEILAAYPNFRIYDPTTGDAAGNAKEPTMRKKMEDHRVRQDCVQCHQLMDPLGFALENFDGIALWRTLDEGQAIDSTAKTFDNTPVQGPDDLRNWLSSKYADQFVTVATEKLLTYGLGREMGYSDREAIDAVVARAEAAGGGLQTLILSIVQSPLFSRR